MEKTIKTKLETEYFTLIELADGVYAAIEKENNTGSNAGFIDLGNCTILFDTFLNLEAARELKKASEQITGRTPAYVINSHSHTDHFIGNCLFDDNTRIMSSVPVRDIIKTAKEEFATEREQYGKRIMEIEAALKTERNKDSIANLNNELLFLRNLVKPEVEIKVPDMTIDKELILYGSKRKVQLIVQDIAHSPGDTIAYLPDDQICFMGDLLFNQSHTWLGSGNPEKFLEVLEDILRKDAEIFVPGHGRVACRADVSAEIQYINELLHLVKRKNSLNAQDYSIKDLSPMFREWKSLCFQWNIDFLLGRMKNSVQEECADESSGF